MSVIKLELTCACTCCGRNVVCVVIMEPRPAVHINVAQKHFTTTALTSRQA